MPNDVDTQTPSIHSAPQRTSAREAIGGLSDDALVTMFQAGDEEVFRVIVERYKERIRNVTANILQDQDLVDDVSQEVFIKAYENLRGFRFESSLYTWLYRIAVNRCRDELRRKKMRRFFSLHGLLETNDRELLRHTSVAPVDTGNREILEAALARLPEKFRIALVLRDVDGLHYEEMAEVLQCELGTVKSRIARGRALLREALLPSAADLDLGPAGERAAGVAR